MTMEVTNVNVREGLVIQSSRKSLSQHRAVLSRHRARPVRSTRVMPWLHVKYNYFSRRRCPD